MTAAGCPTRTQSSRSSCPPAAIKARVNDRIARPLLRLMRVVVTIPYIGAPTPEYPEGEPRVILTALFAFFDLAENEKPPTHRPLRPAEAQLVSPAPAAGGGSRPRWFAP